MDINWQDRFIVILICRWSLLKDRKNFIVTRPQSPVIIYGILIGTYNTKPLEENKPRRLFFNSPSLKKKKFWQKRIKKEHIKDISRGTFSEEQSYKREQFREQLEEHFCSRTSQRNRQLQKRNFHEIIAMEFLYFSKNFLKGSTDQNRLSVDPRLRWYLIVF